MAQRGEISSQPWGQGWDLSQLMNGMCGGGQPVSLYHCLLLLLLFLPKPKPHQDGV